MRERPGGSEQSSDFEFGRWKDGKTDDSAGDLQCEGRDFEFSGRRRKGGRRYKKSNGLVLGKEGRENTTSRIPHFFRTLISNISTTVL